MHIGIDWPIAIACFASAIEPVELLQYSLTFTLRVLAVEWAVVLGDCITGIYCANSVYTNRRPFEVSVGGGMEGVQHLQKKSEMHSIHT